MDFCISVVKARSGQRGHCNSDGHVLHPWSQGFENIGTTIRWDLKIEVVTSCDLVHTYTLPCVFPALIRKIMLRSTTAFPERPEKRDGSSDVIGRRPWFRAHASLFPAGSQNQFREDPSPTTCHGRVRHQIAACEARQLLKFFFLAWLRHVPRSWKIFSI